MADNYYTDLSQIPTDQLQNLSPASGVTSAQLQSEMLRRSQAQGTQGFAGLPALADATGDTPKQPLVPATPGATYAQENFAYPTAQGAVPGQPNMNLTPGAAQTSPGSLPNSQPTHILSSLAGLFNKTTPTNVVPANMLSNGPSQALVMPTDNTDAKYAALLASMPSGKLAPTTPVTLDYDKYADQVKKALPDTMSGVASAINQAKAGADTQSKNALSQGLLAAGLTMLQQRGSFFNALGVGGAAGQQQYLQQKADADKAQQSALGQQLQMADAQSRNNQAIASDATQRAADAATAQYQNNETNIHNQAQADNPAYARMQVQLARLSQQPKSLSDMAEKDYQQNIAFAMEAMKNPMSLPAGMDPMTYYQKINDYATQRRNMILQGKDPGSVPPPSLQQPAGYRR